MGNEVEKMYENANIKPEYRYDCNLADTIKPVEVFPLHSCSKGEIKDYCTNKQDYRYCKVYKVNKTYPPFTAEKQLELIKKLGNINIDIDNGCYMSSEILEVEAHCDTFEETLAEFVNNLWQSLTEEEHKQIKRVLE